MTAEDASGSGTIAGARCGADGIATGPIAIRDNDDALSLQGCTVVDGDLFIDPCRVCAGASPECTACGDPADLTSLRGTEDLERVTGSVFLGQFADTAGPEARTGHEALASLAELQGLREIGGDLLVAYAPALEVAAFPGLESVAGELRIESSFHLDASFPALVEANDLSLLGPSRHSLEFPSLQNVPGNLWLYQTTITNFDGVPALVEVGGVDVTHNDLVSDVSPILAIPRLGGAEFVGLTSLTAVDVPAKGDDFRLTVIDCPAVERVSLSSQTSSLERLYVAENDAMVSLQAPGLRSISGGLQLRDNAALESLAGLASLEYLDTWLTLAGNDRLCQSAVDAFVDGLELGPDVEHWNVVGNGDC